MRYPFILVTALYFLITIINPMKRILILQLLILFALVARAQSTNEIRFTFNHVALSVTDLSESSDFYATVLDFEEITNRTSMAGIRWFRLGQDKELHLISIMNEPVQINKAVHFAISTPDFDQFVERLEKNDVPYSDWPGAAGTITTRADGIRQVYIQDPDGYWIEVNSANE